jgi:quercetin dioxygenase-like cupin family protein
MSTAEAFVVDPVSQPALRIVGEQVRVLADAQSTGSYEVFLQDGPEGAGPPPHLHDWDEAYYMLDGAMTVRLGDREITLSKGQFVHVPRGVMHCFRMHEGGGRFLSLNSGAGASRFFADLDHEVGGKIDIPRILEVAARHQVRIPPPPSA